MGIGHGKSAQIQQHLCLLLLFRFEFKKYFLAYNKYLSVFTFYAPFLLEVNILYLEFTSFVQYYYVE